MAAFLFALFAILYTATLEPTMGWVDSGLFAGLAGPLGLLHPPGFPGYLWISHAATWLPAGSVAHRVNLLSALFGAGGVALAYQTARALLLARPGVESRLATSAA